MNEENNLNNETTSSTQPTVNPEQVTSNTTEKAKNSHSVRTFFFVLVLIVILLGVIIFGLYQYTDILKPKKASTSNEITTTTTTAVVSTDKTIDLTGNHFDSEYQYAYKLYLKDNKLYALLTMPAQFEYDDKSIDFEGQKLYFVKDEVKDVFAVEFGMSGYIDAIITDLSGQAYRVNMIVGLGEPFAITRIMGATNVVNAYSLDSFDATDLILIDKDNNIIASENLVYVDKKNNIWKNKLIDGTIVEIKLISQTKENEVETVVYKAYINGKEFKRDIVVQYNLAAVDGYDGYDLLDFDLCTDSNGEYAIGHDNCFVE